MMNADLPFWKDFLQFCQKLINTPSLPGEEGPVAHLIQDKMKQLDYDDVHIDRVGNVIGLIKGTRNALPCALRPTWITSTLGIQGMGIPALLGCDFRWISSWPGDE